MISKKDTFGNSPNIPKYKNQSTNNVYKSSNNLNENKQNVTSNNNNINNNQPDWMGNFRKDNFNRSNSFKDNSNNIIDKSHISETREKDKDIDLNLDEYSYFNKNNEIGENNNIDEDNFVTGNNFNEIRNENKHDTAGFHNNNYTLDKSKIEYNDLLMKIRTQENQINRLQQEKESYEERVSSLKLQIKEDKHRYESNLADIENNHKNIEKKNEESLNAIIKRLKEELKLQEDRIKEQTKEYFNEKEKMKLHLEDHYKKQIEIIKSLNLDEINRINKHHNEQISYLKKTYEDEIDIIKKHTNSNGNLEEVSKKLENSTNQVTELVMKIQQQEISDRNVNEIAKSKEFFYNDYETKLKNLESELNKERERLLKQSKDQELSLMERKREIQEERSRLDRENTRLIDLQSTLKSLEYQFSQKYEIEKLSLAQKESELKIEIENIKSDLKQKIIDLEHQKKLFNEEKIFFEKYKEETLKNIEVKKREIDTKRDKFLDEEKEIKSRIKVLQEKEYYANQQLSQIEEKNDELLNKENELDKEQKEILKSVIRLEESIKKYDLDMQNLSKDKEVLRNMKLEIENERSLLYADKIKVSQKEQEINNRMISIDVSKINLECKNQSHQ